MISFIKKNVLNYKFWVFVFALTIILPTFTEVQAATTINCEEIAQACAGCNTWYECLYCGIFLFICNLL